MTEATGSGFTTENQAKIKADGFLANYIFWTSYTLENVYVDLLVFTCIAGTS